jgi:hypothetical protein
MSKVTCFRQSNFFPLSTHYTHIYEIVALAGIRDMLSGNLIIYGFKGKDFTMGINLSNEVRKTISRFAGCPINEIEKGPEHFSLHGNNINEHNKNWFQQF